MQYEPIFYLTEADGPKDSNYLQVIYKIDKINAERLRAKKEYTKKMGDWKNQGFTNFDEEEEKAIPLSSLVEEGLKLMKLKEARIAKEAKEAEEYKAKLKKVYKFKKFKDDTKFDKIIGNIQIDPKELEIYDKYLPTTKKSRVEKKLNLRIEAKPDELEKSFNDEEDSLRCNDTLKDAGFEEVDDLDLKNYTFGINEIITESNIPNLVAQAIASDTFNKTLLKKDKKKRNSRIGFKLMEGLEELVQDTVG